MPPTDSTAADFDALNDFIVNCPELADMEQLMGGFNLFSVLGAESNELRHSNVLAWLCTPTESHGLQDNYLKRWLMAIIHEADANAPLTPIDIDCWDLASVEVRREWKHIDLLLILKMGNQEQPWVICIENKVNSSQHSNQLSRYKEIVEEHFPQAPHKLYIFLTKDNEEPEDSSYLPASYTQVHNILENCVESASHAIGDEPRVLINNYLRLLSEKFMNDSQIAQLAEKIYQKHKRAIDIINEHKPDNQRLFADELYAQLKSRADELEILPETGMKRRIRFTPKAWDLPGNSHGAAWSNCKRNLIFEIKIGGKTPTLVAVSGQTPLEWITPVWERSATPPFKRNNRGPMGKSWITLHSVTKSIKLNLDEADDLSALASKVLDWVGSVLKEGGTKEVIKIIADELPKLDDLQTPSSK